MKPPAASATAKAKPLRQRPEFNQLELFLKVLETRSFAAAGRQTGRTQQSVSQSIARLEDICGGDLFERRRGMPLALTPIGKAILPTARLLISVVDEQLMRATQTAQSRVGSLTVGFYPGIVSGPLRAAFAELIADSPDVGLHLVEGVPGELHRRLNERSIDIMFGALMPDISSSSLVQENLWRERLVVALPEAHALAAKPRLDWRDVASLPIILRIVLGEISGYRAIVARIGDRPLDCEHHAVSRGTLLELVAMGLGATVSFESTVEPRDGVVFRPIHDRKSVIPIMGAWHDGDRNPLRHRLLGLVRKHANRKRRSR